MLVMKLRRHFHIFTYFETNFTNDNNDDVTKGARSVPWADSLATGVAWIAKARAVMLYRRQIGARIDVMNMHDRCGRAARSDCLLVK